MDPSLALGFLCKDKTDFDDLCTRITDLAAGAGMAPLFTVAENPPPEPSCDVWSDENMDENEHKSADDEDWQML